MSREITKWNGIANSPALTSVTLFPFPTSTINVPTWAIVMPVDVEFPYVAESGCTYQVSWDDAGQVRKLEGLAGQ